jgi:predicted TIM-barrel enzyme
MDTPERRANLDPSRSAAILPVIHYADDSQALRNAERAFDAGCEGVMLIEMRGYNRPLVKAAASIKTRWPDKLVGVNFLNSEPDAPLKTCAQIDMSWTDEQLTHSCRSPWLEARRTARTLRERSSHLFFCGVAFKYQQAEPDPVQAAVRAIAFGFIPTTSGAATGAPADASVVRDIRQGIGVNAPLALASGVTPENAGAFLPFVSHILVSSGVSASFHEFEPSRLRALVAARDSGSRSQSQDRNGLGPEAGRTALRRQRIAPTKAQVQSTPETSNE